MTTTIYFESNADLYKFIQKVVFNKQAEKDGGFCSSNYSEFTSIPCFNCIDLKDAYFDCYHDDEHIKAICNRLKLTIKNIYTIK